MFGAYEIEYEGRKYFGNVSLREFHKFRRNGGVYLFVSEKMAAQEISESMSLVIDKASSSSGGLIPEALVEELRKLDLLDEDDGDMSEKAEMDAGDSGGKDKKTEVAVRSIALFVAQECNMRCVYCYGEGGEYAAKGMMSDETAFRAVDWLMDNSKSLEKVNISFFGGEPLLNFPLVKKVVEYAKTKASERNKEITFGITTNASLLTDEIIGFIRDEKIYPLVSFDGPPAVQNRQRPFKDGSGSYDAVYGNIQKLLGVSPKLLARGTVYGDTDPCEIKEGMKRAGLKACYVIKASPVILAGENGKAAKNAADEEISSRMTAFQEKEFDVFLKSVKDRSMEMNRAGHMLRPIITGEKRYFGCGIGRGMVGISISGDIYPCHRFAGQDDAKMGNIADYKAEGPNDYHRSIVNNLPKCSVCWAKYFCGGGCFYDNKSRTGDMHIPDILYCDEMKRGMETAIYISTRLDEGDKEYIIKTCNDLMDDKLP